MSAKRCKATLTFKYPDGEVITLETEGTLLVFDDKQDEASRDEAMRFASTSMMRDALNKLGVEE